MGYADNIKRVLDREMIILMVDDDPIQCSFAELHLKSEKIQLIFARDAETGLVKASETMLNFILVDYDMPGMNGIEMVRALRRTAKHFRTPIIMITGSNDRAILTEAYEAGVDFLDTKPVDWRLLAHQIKYVFERKRT